MSNIYDKVLNNLKLEFTSVVCDVDSKVESDDSLEQRKVIKTNDNLNNLNSYSDELCDVKSNSVDSITSDILAKAKENLKEADISSTLDPSIIDQLKEFGINPLYLDMPSIYDIKSNGKKYEYKIVEVRPNRIVYKSKLADADGGFGNATYQMDFKQFAQLIHKTDISGKRINAIKLKNALHKFNEEEFTKKLLEERDRRIDVYLNYIKPDDHYGTHADFSIYKTANPKLYEFLKEKQSANTADAKNFNARSIKDSIINHQVGSGELSTDQRDFIKFELLNYENSSIDGSLEELIRSDTTGELYNNLMMGKDVSKSKKNRDFHEKLRQERNATKILSQIGNIPPEATDTTIVSLLSAIPGVGPLVGGLLVLSKQFGYSPTYYVNAVRRAVLELTPQEQQEFTTLLTEFTTQLPNLMDRADINKSQIDTINSYKQLGDNIPTSLKKVQDYLVDFIKETYPNESDATKEQLYEKMVKQIFDGTDINQYIENANNYTEQMKQFVDERNTLIKEKEQLRDEITKYLQNLPESKTKLSLASLKHHINAYKDKIEKLANIASNQSKEINAVKKQFMQNDLQNFDNALAKIRETIDKIISKQQTQGKSMNKKLESLSRQFVDNLLTEYYGNNEAEANNSVDKALDVRLRNFNGVNLLVKKPSNTDAGPINTIYVLSINYSNHQIQTIKNYANQLEHDINVVRESLPNLRTFNTNVKYSDRSLINDIEAIKPLLYKLKFASCFSELEKTIIGEYEDVVRNITSTNKTLNTSDILRENLKIKHHKNTSSSISILVNKVLNSTKHPTLRTIFDVLIFYLERKLQSTSKKIDEINKTKQQMVLQSMPLPNSPLDIPQEYLIRDKNLEEYTKSIDNIQGMDPEEFLESKELALVPLKLVYRSHIQLDNDEQIKNTIQDMDSKKHGNLGDFFINALQDSKIESVVDEIFTNVLLEKNNSDKDLLVKYGFKNPKTDDSENMSTFLGVDGGKQLFAKYLISNPAEYFDIVHNLEKRVQQYNKQYDDKVIEIHNLSENGVDSFELNYNNPNIFVFGYYAFVAKNASGKKHIEQLKQMSYSSVDPSYIRNVLNSLDYNTTVNTYSRNSIINLLKSGIHPVLYAYKNKAKLEFDDLPGDWKVVKVGKEKNDTQFVLLGHDVEIPDSELLVFDSVDRLQGLKNRLERVISKTERDSNIIETIQSNLKDIDNFSSMKQVMSLFNIDDMSQINNTTINDLIKLIKNYKDDAENINEENKEDKSDKLSKLDQTYTAKVNDKLNIINQELEKLYQKYAELRQDAITQLDEVTQSSSYIDYLKRGVIANKNVYDIFSSDLLDKSQDKRKLEAAESLYKSYIEELVDKYIADDKDLSFISQLSGDFGLGYEYYPHYRVLTAGIMKNLNADYQKITLYLIAPIEKLMSAIENENNAEVLKNLAKNYHGDDLRSIIDQSNQIQAKNEKDLKVLNIIKNFMREQDYNYYVGKLKSVKSIEDLKPMEFINLRKLYFNVMSNKIDIDRESLPHYRSDRTPVQSLPSSADTVVTNEFMKMLRPKKDDGVLEDFVSWSRRMTDDSKETLIPRMYDYLESHQNIPFVKEMVNKLGGFPEFEDLDLDAINSRLKRLKIDALKTDDKPKSSKSKIVRKQPKSFNLD